MPLYEFKCVKCEEMIEVLTSMGTKKVPCSNCGGDAIKKPFSTFAFVVQGGTPKNLTKQLHDSRDELDTTLDSIQQAKADNERQGVVSANKRVVPPKTGKHIDGL